MSVTNLAWTPRKLFQSGNISIVVEDGATPFFQAAEIKANVLARSCTSRVSKIFTERVSKAFDEGSERARPNTEATLEWKRYMGKGILSRPLIATGNLEKAIKKPEVSMSEADFMWINPGAAGSSGKSVVTVTWMLPSAGQDVYLPGMQVRKNPDFTYLWAHEQPEGFKNSRRMYKFGIKAWGNFDMPKRAFLFKGLKDAMRESLAYTTMEIKAFYDWMKSKEAPQFSMPGVGMEREFRWGGRDLVMLGAPPTRLYAGIGGGLDYLNVLRGQFSVANFEQWLVQMGKGKIGMTRLSQRRQVRKRLWK